MLGTGFLVRYSHEVRGPHVFCGPNTTDVSPCPNCQKPMLQMLRLDLTDPKLKPFAVAFGMALLPLLWCWTCDISIGPLVYELGNGGRSARLLEWHSGGQGPDRPYAAYPVAFPRAGADLSPIEADVARNVRRLNRREISLGSVDKEAWARPRHQVGGEPVFCGDFEPMRPCAGCGGQSDFLAAIADNCLDPRGFSENEFVQTLFWYCTRCHRVEAMQDCD